MMQCDDLAERLTDLLEGDLGESEEAAAIEHLASCPACETVLAETRDVVQVAAAYGRASLSDDDRNRMLSSVIGAIDESTST